MAQSPSRSESLAKNWPVVVAVCFAAVLVGVWWWPRTPAELSEHGYDVTLALYRVCNQRSEAGLVQIEEQLTIMDKETPLSQQSRTIIADIISQAKSGNWQDACVACREALEDQVVKSK